MADVFFNGKYENLLLSRGARNCGIVWYGRCPFSMVNIRPLLPKEPMESGNLGNQGNQGTKRTTWYMYCLK